MEKIEAVSVGLPQSARGVAYSRYYRRFIKKFYEYTLPANSRVLLIGFVDTYVVQSIKQRAAYVENVDAAQLSAHTQVAWDYVIISSACLATVPDVGMLLENTVRASSPGTRIIIEYSQVFWLPLVYCAQMVGLKRRLTPLYSYTSADIQHFIALAGGEVVEEKRELLLPVFIPFVSALINYTLARVPVISALCYKRFYIVRPRSTIKKEYSVSVIIPCKNEAGNIYPALQRCPSMGLSTELIFVDGHSRDNSAEVFTKLPTEYEGKKVSWFTQSGKGKKNAVEEGFARATGDILIILDGDITVEPEEMSKFYDAIANNAGECINGSRLVYPMERGAMPPLNWLVNYAFGVLGSYIIGQRVKDTLCGTKVVHRTSYQKMLASQKFFGDFDPFGDFDILCGAAYHHMKIVDIPVHYKSRRYGTSQISYFSNGVLLLRMLWIMVQKMLLRL